MPKIISKIIPKTTPKTAMNTVCTIANAPVNDRTMLRTLTRRFLKRDRQDVHKGTFGNLAIIGGACGMTGAPILAARAARAMGVGKITVGFLGDNPLFDPNYPELMCGAAGAVLDAASLGAFDACVVGCGLGQGSEASRLVNTTLSFSMPLVLDADALNLIAQAPHGATLIAARTHPTILTPHPAEAARLLASSVSAVQEDRIGAAQTLAARYHATVVLKGQKSVIASFAGEPRINPTGNNALSFGGTGDLLSGMVGALLAQRRDDGSDGNDGNGNGKDEGEGKDATHPVTDAVRLAAQLAVLAVGLHGLAADLYVEKEPACAMTSHDFLHCLRRAVGQCLSD